MARKSLVSVVADALLDRIVSGEFEADAALPTAAELSQEYDVSRMTLREALATLQTQNVVRVVAGRGAYVTPIAQWTDIAPVLRMASHGAAQDEASLQLVEVRRMIETGAAALAATRRSDADVALLEIYLDDMRRGNVSEDLELFVSADIAFHDVILRATGNVFVGVLFDPLARVMRDKRQQTSAVPEIQVHAIAEHESVLEAIRSGDAERARLTMDSHMTQTSNDLRHFVLKSPN
ncbi:DNA-binding FadR family transcriptional regulator [Rhodoglobus vestalii]|uniref:DNA-binding FadR family transcriptional regulator n=1 Tax=Rhodoglobus vestalii TaxID=193384 RepID=A0A8H2PU56_9MICO|nr:FadR/GntR family transcriptional regulator [Rhodoglobus vestalii]TQO19252.1 DNA-binding FadR family transcriptional regulator [Rhodoglobus vestalii]